MTSRSLLSFLRAGLLTLVAMTFAASISGAAVLLSDNLTYPDGDIVGQGGWTAHSGAGVRPVQIVSGTAVLENGGSGEDVNSPFAAQGALASTYASFTLIVTDPGGGHTDEYYVHFKDSGFGFRARFSILNAGGGGDYTVGIAATSFTTTPPVPWPSDLTFGVRYRIVFKYDAATGDAEMWVDPTAETDPSVLSTGGVSGTPVEAIALRQDSDNGYTATVDDILVATTFNEVCPVCAPTPALSRTWGELKTIYR